MKHILIDEHRTKVGIVPDSAHCGSVDDDNHSVCCDGYDLAIDLIAARRKSLIRDLRKVKKRMREIEEKGVRWRG